MLFLSMYNVKLCSCYTSLSLTNSGLTNEKSLNSSWFMLAVTFLSVGVNFGSSLVKSVSKFRTSVLERCKGEKKKHVKVACVTIRSLT